MDTALVILMTLQFFWIAYGIAVFLVGGIMTLLLWPVFWILSRLGWIRRRPTSTPPAIDPLQRILQRVDGADYERTFKRLYPHLAHLYDK